MVVIIREEGGGAILSFYLPCAYGNKFHIIICRCEIHLETVFAITCKIIIFTKSIF